MDKQLLEDFLCGFDESCYPEDFLREYEPVECLSHNQMGETLLVRNRQSDEVFITKCYAKDDFSVFANESELLKDLHHDGLPVFVGEYQNGGMQCVVREYAQGVPLDEFARNRALTQEQIISIGAQLSDVLAYLHGQKPPVIHRDIKPQNIIIGDDGKIKLIDFGISRAYDENAGKDTVCFGTAQFAPPEQYGFSQTDNRADIFSLGVVLCYLLTGETDVKAVASIENRRLSKLIEKCTAFDPKDRYHTAQEVKRALLHADGHTQKKITRILCCVLALLATFIGGFTIGRYTEYMPAFLHMDVPVRFKEPMIEQAVRKVLHKDSQAPITSEELAEVTELYIWGNVIASDSEAYYAQGSAWYAEGGARDNEGSITQLSDIAMLPSLKVLMVANQQIEDISPLSAVTSLQVLDLDKNPVTDITALSSLRELKDLNLNETEVFDLSPLASCSKLTKLVLSTIPCDDFSVLASMNDFDHLHVVNIQPEKILPYLQGKTVRQIKLGYVILPSIADLSGIKGVQELYLDQVYLKDLSGIDQLPYLTDLELIGMKAEDLTPLLSLSYLKQVKLDEAMRETAGVALKQAQFSIIYH